MIYQGFCDIPAIPGDPVPDAVHFVDENIMFLDEKKKFLIPPGPGSCIVALCGGGGEVVVCNDDVSPTPQEHIQSDGLLVLIARFIARTLG